MLASLDALDVPPPPAIPKLPAARRASWRIARIAALAAAVVAVAGSIAVPRYEHDRASERAYAEIALMLATDPTEVAPVGDRDGSGRAIVGEAHRRSGFEPESSNDRSPRRTMLEWSIG